MVQNSNCKAYHISIAQISGQEIGNTTCYPFPPYNNYAADDFEYILSKDGISL